MWNKIGLNLQEEWIEENSETKQRRVSTPAGYLIEPVEKHNRWGRLTNKNDAERVAHYLSYSHIFKSFGSVKNAAKCWIGDNYEKNLLGFQKEIEKNIIERSWNSFVHGFWSNSLPDWNTALRLKTTSGWPLWLDIGLFKTLYNDSNKTPTFEQYNIWRNNQLKSGEIVVGLNVSHGLTIEKWGVFHKKIKSGTQTVEQWSGLQPPLLQDEEWTSDYIAFTSLSSDVSGYVDPLLNQALKQAHPPLLAKDVRLYLSQQLNIPEEDLNNRLSNDQLDAVWLALKKLENGDSFLLGDETGYGKGRILAALAKVALNNNIQILFFTEKKALLSDFYRDCAVLFNDNIPTPAVLHSSAKVLTPTGDLAFGKKINRSPVESDQWVWTTYSQFNRNNPEKLKNIVSWVSSKKTWILMDEAQNAAGNSNTSQSLKKIQKSSNGIIFSSATFAKNEEQLHAYERLFQGKKYEWERLLSAFTADSDGLRAAIALLWAEQGVFLRREHPPMALPDAFWVPINENIAEQNRIFSQWWQLMLQCARVWSRGMNKMEGGWAKIGAHLSRANREFSLLQKQHALINCCINSVQDNQKPVVIADWTLSSHVARLVSNKKEELASQTDEADIVTDNEEIVLESSGIVFSELPTWKNSWSLIVSEIFPDEDLLQALPSLVTEMEKSRRKVLDCIQQLPNWSVSPFDDVISALAARDIKVLEISGRNWQLVEDTGKWKIQPRVQDNRTKIVQDFNAGLAEIALVTRAGNSGISLHAGKLFKDQRQRHLIEWDVAPDPSVRIQFWGRVRRKDQVIEPQRSTLLIDTPFERRRLNRDTVKQRRLSSHSGRSQTKVEDSWIGKEGSFVAKEWLRLHPHARSLLDPGPDANVEKILTRSVVLQDYERLNLLVQLERGVSLFRDWAQERSNVWNKPSRVSRKKWWWGSGEHQLEWQERLWEPRPTATKEDVFKELSRHSSGQSQTAEHVIAQWKSIWEKWWIEQPHQKTTDRIKMLNWWTSNYSQFERGKGIEATDPQVFGRTRGIVLGWEGPSSSDGAVWSPSQIKVYVWLSSMDKPMALSLSAWMSSSFGNIKPTSTLPSPSWFTGMSTPTRAMVLVGPPWSISAWGARSAPVGQLIHLKDDDGATHWGWKMPEYWSWEHMLKTDCELASVMHALNFIKTFPNDTITWKCSAQSFFTTTVQADGLLLSGKINAMDCLSFPLLRKCGTMQWDNTRTQWYLLLPTKEIRWAFFHWFSFGAVPVVSSVFAQWNEKTWKSFEGK